MARNLAALSDVQNRNVLRDQYKDDDSASFSDTVTKRDGNHDTSRVTQATNDTLAANLGVAFPRTPQRAMPNSARKRRQVPDLSRCSASPSHREKISSIFRDASTTLQGLSTPSCRPSSNSRIPRLPLSQARSVRFGSISQDDTKLTPDVTTLLGSRRTQELCAILQPELPKIARSPAADRQHHTTNEMRSDENVIDGSLLSYQGCTASLARHPSPISARQTDGAGRALGFEEEGHEPISSGFGTPCAFHGKQPETPTEVKYPDFELWHLPRSLSAGVISSGSGSGACHSSSVGPISLPASSSSDEDTHTGAIDRWLNNIQSSLQDTELPQAQRQERVGVDVAMKDSTNSPATFGKARTQRVHLTSEKSGACQRSLSRVSSNKENLSPAKSTPSPTRCRILSSTAAPSRFRNRNIQAATEPNPALDSAQSLTPQGHLSLPPKRKKPCNGGEAKLKPLKSGKDFTIHHDQVVDALAQLSPDVELRRKGRRPKRERCMSYWDEDMLPPGSPCLPKEAGGSKAPVRKGKTVLGESQQSVELTKERPFTAATKNAAFDFQA